LEEDAFCKIFQERSEELVRAMKAPAVKAGYAHRTKDDDVAAEALRQYEEARAELSALCKTQLNEWHDCKHVSAEGLKWFPLEASLRLNFKKAHKVILLRGLKQKRPPSPLTAPLNSQETDLSKP
jgi:hypothetical protein